MGNAKIFVDWNYSPSFVDKDFGGRRSSSQEWNLGVESPINGSNFNWYGGTSYGARVTNSEDKDDSATASLSAGLSKKGDHSMNFGGITWKQAIEGNPFRLLLINFGTQFDY